MGEPKATDMPAAAAAENTSRLRAKRFSYGLTKRAACITFIVVHGAEQLHEQIRRAASNMDQGSFLA